MKDYLSRYSGSLSNSDDEYKDASIVKQSLTDHPQYSVRLGKGEDTTTIKRTGVCFFSHASGVTEEKTAIIQERVLDSDVLMGKIVGVMEKYVMLDVRSSKYPQKRLKLKVQKKLVLGSEKFIQLDTCVSVSYQRIVNYQGEIAKKVAVRLREPAVMPVSIIEDEIETKLKRFSYMFEK